MSTTMSPAEALRTMGLAADIYGPTVNTVCAPQSVDILGEALAGLLRTVDVSTVVVWNTSDEAVLAHSVVRSLGVGMRWASEVEGVLTFNETLEPGSRVALLATQWTQRRWEALRGLVTNSGGRAVVVAAVLPSDSLSAVDDLPTMALIGPDQAAEFLS